MKYCASSIIRLHNLINEGASIVYKVIISPIYKVIVLQVRFWIFEKFPKSSSEVKSIWNKKGIKNARCRSVFDFFIHKCRNCRTFTLQFGTASVERLASHGMVISTPQNRHKVRRDPLSCNFKLQGFRFVVNCRDAYRPQVREKIERYGNKMSGSSQKLSCLL